jgi:broad specificity phosphatase PhoE
MHFVFPRLKESVPYVKELLDAIVENPSLKKRNMLLAFQFFMEKWSEDKIDVPEVESWKIFRENVKSGLSQILENTGKGEIIGAFTSGGTISSIAGESLGIKDEKKIVAMNFSVRNTSFTSFLFSKNKFNLLSFNELPHLEKEMITFI